jgi:hypothetical protein
VLLASLLIGYVPQAVLIAGGAVLLLGLVTGIGFRRGLLGSAWRMLLAVAVLRAGFWLPEAWLVPMLTAAVAIMAIDVVWTIGGDLLREEADARLEEEELEARRPAHEMALAVSAIPANAGRASRQVAVMPARMRPVAVDPPRGGERVPQFSARRTRTHLPAMFKLLAAAAMAFAVVATAPPELASRTSQLIGLLVDYGRALAGLITGSG